MSLRIGLVSLHTDPLDPPGIGDAGGMNVHVLALAEQLAALGDDVEIVTRRTDPNTAETVLLRSGVIVRRLQAGAEGLPKSALPSVLGPFSTALAMLPRFDVLHSHYWLSAAAALPVARECQSDHVVSMHTVAVVKNRALAPGDAPEPADRIRSERQSIRASDAIIVASATERDAVTAEYGANPARVHTIAPGVDGQLFRPRARAEWPLWLTERAAGRPVVSVVGRIQPLKGQELALRTIAAMSATARPLLVLAGETSPGHDHYAARLRALAGPLGVDLEMPGALSREETAQLIAASALVLVPSHSETFGLVALEAAACGVPVLGASNTGLQNSIAEGRSGALVEGRDPRQWAAFVEALLRDPPERARLGRGGLAFAAEHSWKATAERTRAVYLGLHE